MRLSDLMNASTPPRRTSRSSSPGHPPSSPRDSSPCPSLTGNTDLLPTTPVISRKRPYEDLGQYAEYTSRNLKLKPAGEANVKKFAELSSPKQRIAIFANLESLRVKVEDVQAPEPAYSISQTLNSKIERLVTCVLLSPSLPAYKTKDVPRKILSHLENHPSWGLTAAVKADVTKYNIISKRVTDRLTQRRNIIKNLIKVSSGNENDKGAPLDILELCESLANLVNHHGPELQVSLPMVARIAFLRMVFVENMEGDPKVEGYWSIVDGLLADLRNKKKTDAGISSFFAQTLEKDREMYGRPGLDQLVDKEPEYVEGE
ncbi:hypothetical protein H0H93_000680 [Arthromyces matolae]|nr:hypothetical protein H0H93_000680 [Arthromyces matolae]